MVPFASCLPGVWLRRAARPAACGGLVLAVVRVRGLVTVIVVLPLLLFQI